MKNPSLILLAFCLSLTSLIAQTEGSGETIEDKAFATVVYLVRHAEKAKAKGKMMDKDPELTTQGKNRAQELAHVLKDAGIQYIYSSNYKRTKATAQPIANLLGLEVQIYDPRQLDGLVDVIQQQPGRYLIVGHSNTTPDMVKLLGGEPGPPIDDATEYDRLYTVVLQEGVQPVTVLMRYGIVQKKK